MILQIQQKLEHAAGAARAAADSLRADAGSLRAGADTAVGWRRIVGRIFRIEDLVT